MSNNFLDTVSSVWNTGTHIMTHKLTASALSAFLRSPKSFYWAYLHQNARGVEPLPNMKDYAHDLVFGQLWGEFVTYFYANTGMPQDFQLMWKTRTNGWVDAKTQEQYANVLQALMLSYLQQFSPTDGVRTPESSERRYENDRFYGFIDGISDDGILHECKTAKRAMRLDEQLWQVQNSIQIKLYVVLTQAAGVCIEFAYKDAPCSVFRTPIVHFNGEQRDKWQWELNSLADGIALMTERSLKLGHMAFPCHPSGCTINTKNFTGTCKYRMLCDSDPTADHFYITRNEERR